MQERGKGNKVVSRLIYNISISVVEILLALLLVFGIAKCCQSSYYFCYEVFGSVSVDKEPGENKDFQVRESDDMYHVAKRLGKEKLIKNPYSFYARTMMMARKEIVLRPGSYVLNTSMDYEDIINELTMSE